MYIRVLLIEDNYTIAEQLCDFLEQHYFQVDYASDGRMGLKLIEKNRYDVILLDLTLPDIDGIKLCYQIKQQGSFITPVLMLTARDSLSDKGEGFDAGADDYLTKPFELEEVSMRCRALARRIQLHQSNKLIVGQLTIDVQQHVIKRNNEIIRLSAKDYKILLLLAQAYPNALSRTSILEKVWGDNFPDSNVLRSHIYTLRNAVDKPFNYSMIKTIHGVGFKLIEAQ